MARDLTIVWTVLLAWIAVTSGSAQEWSAPSDRVTRLDTLPGVQLRFERMLNTFSWNGTAVVDESVGPWRFRADQRVSSRLIRAGRSLRQEEYSGRVDIDRALTAEWDALMQQRSSSVSGPAGVDLGDVALHRILGGVRAGSVLGPNVTGLIGWEWNRQAGRNDAGLSGSVAGELPGVDWEQLLLQGRGMWSASSLGDRRPSDASAEISVRRPFAAGSEYSLSAMYQGQRRDLPAAGTGLSGEATSGPGALLRRVEDLASVQQALTWSIDPTLDGRVDAGWRSRQIERRYSLAGGPLPTGITQSELSASGHMNWEPARGWWNVLSLGFTQGEEQHEVLDASGAAVQAADEQWRQARRRNHQTQRLVLAVRSGMALSEETDLTMSASSNILRYDTPDTLNTDDRDELLLTASVELMQRLGPRLSVQVVLDGAFDHLVFLSRYQSANNVTIRTLRLAPSVLWRVPGGIWNVLRAEVAASYSAFDFEDQVGGVQSYSYRQAMWGDSLIVPLGRTLQLEFSGSLRLFERGLFRWRDFRERPERSFTEVALWPRLRVVHWAFGSLAVGFRSFRQERTVIRDGVRSYAGSIGSSGPTVDVEYMWPAARLIISGWRETQRSDGRSLAAISNVMLQLRTVL